MEAFDELRRKAKDLRDKTMAQAREHYEASLKSIAQLERDLVGKCQGTHKSVAASIEAAMPRDRSFTLTELMATLEVISPDRSWGYRVINHRITFLVSKGFVRRLRRSNGKQQAVYARADATCDLKPQEVIPLVWYIEQALRELGPMGLTPLAVAILERGYKTRSGVGTFRNTVCRLLRAYREKFSKTDGKWGAG